MAASARATVRLLAAVWCMHGGIMLFIAALAGPLQAQTEQEVWLEAMDLLHASWLIEPTQKSLALVLAGRTILVAVGIFSLVVGMLTWRWPQWARWPLHACAVAHLIMVPWAAWVAHDAVAAIVPGVMGLVAEVLTVLATEAGLVVAMVATERLHRQEAFTLPSTRPPSRE